MNNINSSIKLSKVRGVSVVSPCDWGWKNLNIRCLSL